MTKFIKIIVCSLILFFPMLIFSQENNKSHSIGISKTLPADSPINQSSNSELTKVPCTTSTKVIHEEINADQRAIYIGIDAGFSIPVIDQIKHSKTNIRLKKSKMYSGRIGYSFYPGMNIEFSVTNQPKYKVNCTIPANTLIPVAISGGTRIKTKTYMINLIYDFAPISTGLRPYVLGGIGFAQLKIFPKDLSYNDIKIFKIIGKDKNCKAWQIGLGFTKELMPNFFIDCSAKLQVIHDIKLHYATLDTTTGTFVKGIPIKTKSALGEYGIGFIYKIPF